MADDIDSLLDARASGKSVAAAVDPIDALLDARAAGKEIPKAPSHVSWGSHLWNATKGAADLGYSAATLGGAGALSSVAYAGAAAGKFLGMDVDPKKVSSDVQNYFTQSPMTESGQAALQGIKDVAAPVVAPVAGALDRSATAVGKVSPFAETMMREAPAAAGAAGGLLGLSPLAAPAMAVARAVPGAARAVGRGAVKAGEKLAAAPEALSDAAVRATGGTPRAPAVIEAAEDINPLARESMGAAAAVPNFTGMSSELQAAVRDAARKTGGAVPRDVLERHVEADALPVKMQLSEGQATQDPVLISNERNRRMADPQFAARFADQNQQLKDNLDTFRREAAPSVVANDPVQNGQMLLDEYKSHDVPVRAEIKAAYDDALASAGGDIQMDATGFATKADAALKGKMKTRYLPGQIAADLQEVREAGVMNFETFENLRTNLAAEARKASRSGDGNAATAISTVRDALESAEPVGVAKDVKAKFDKARGLAKARFDRMREDPAYAAAVDDDVPVGEVSPIADKFVEKYVLRASKAHVQRMGETLAASDTAREVMASAALNHLKSKAGVDMYTGAGNFSQKGYNAALAELSPKLDALVGPKVAEQTRVLGNVAHNVMSQPEGSAVNNSNTFVAAMGEKAKDVAKGVAERGVNAVLPGAGLGTLAREKIAARSERKAAEKALAPGAGLTRLRELSNVGKPGKP